MLAFIMEGACGDVEKTKKGGLTTLSIVIHGNDLADGKLMGRPQGRTGFGKRVLVSDNVIRGVLAQDTKATLAQAHVTQSANN